MIQLTIFSDFAAGAYTNINAADAYLTVGYTGGGENGSYLVNNGGASLTGYSDFFGSTARKGVEFLTPFATYLAGLGLVSYPTVIADNYDNVNISIGGWNGDGALTGGHEDNSLFVSVLYTTVTVLS